MAGNRRQERQESPKRKSGAALGSQPAEGAGGVMVMWPWAWV